MAYELKQIQYVDLTSVDYAKYEMYDVNNSTTFTLSSATYEVIAATDGTVVLSGSSSVNNTDTDAEGNTIKTIQSVLTFTNTDISTGYYYLILKVTLSTGEIEIFRVTYQVKNYKEVY